MEMKLFLFVFLISLPSVGQRVIKNEITKDHIRTDGTNIHLIPPSEFIPSTKQRGYTHSHLDANIIVHVLEIPVDVVHKQMSQKVFAGQGWDLTEEEKISVNGMKGFLIKANRPTTKGRILKWTLIFDYNDTTNVVQCIFPDGNNLLKQDLERALFSVVFKPLVELPNKTFELRYEQFGFSFWKVVNGINHYRNVKKGGIELTFASDHFLIKDLTTEPELIFYNKMKQMPFTSVKLTDTGMEAIEIDGLSGLQAILKTKNERNEIGHAYQVLINQEQNYFLLQGTSPTIEGLDTIIELVKTFKKGKLPN
jgi:hypothetical protein